MLENFIPNVCTHSFPQHLLNSSPVLGIFVDSGDRKVNMIKTLPSWICLSTEKVEKREKLRTELQSTTFRIWQSREKKGQETTKYLVMIEGN